MTTYRVKHSTVYEYAENVSYSYNEACMAPRILPEQECLESSITISPHAQCRFRTDYFGNRLASFQIGENHNRLEVLAESTVTKSNLAFHPPDVDWMTTARRLKNELTPAFIEAREFVLPSPRIPVFEELYSYARPSFDKFSGMNDALQNLMERMKKDFKYEAGSTKVNTTIQEALHLKRGVCQDFAHLFTGFVRSVGLAARYVSGYLETIPPPGKARMVGADASHAWSSVFFPDSGWVDFDPTNMIRPSSMHITIAWGRDYSDVTPLKGILFGGGEHSVKVSVDVQRLD